jgi:hypothetical protein
MALTSDDLSMDARKKVDAARLGALLGRVRPEDYVESVDTRRPDRRPATVLDPEQERWIHTAG